MNMNIVLLHGWGTDSKKLKPLKNELTKAGWNVLLFDLPGFGKEKLTKSYNVKDYSKFVASHTNRYFKGKKFVVFGHSNGGRIAIGINKYYPKNLVGLVLCAAGGISRPFLVKRIIFYVAAKIGNILLIIPGIAKKFRENLYKAAREHDYEKTSGYLKQTMKNMLIEKTKKHVSVIKIPTLIIWGRIDRMTPIKDAKYLNKKIENSKLIVYDEVGHTLPYDKPSDVAQEINLWSKLFI